MFLSKTVRVLSFSLIVLSLHVSRTSRIFLSYIYGEMCNVFGCSQSNCPWNSFVCSVPPDDSYFPFMLCCWCSMHRVSTVFIDLPIYFLFHEQSGWYTSGWLFGNSFGYSFDKEFAIGCAPTWRQYLSLFFEFMFYFWTNVYFWINIVSIYYIVFVDVLSIIFIVVFYHYVFQES